MDIDRRPIITYGVLLAAGTAVGGVQLAAGVDPVPQQPVATANAIHVALAIVALAALVVARRRAVPFLRRPFTAAGWRDLTGALLWRTRGVRPLRFLAAVLMLYTPLRAGLQVLAGLDPDFTRNAWGGPTYAGAMAAHYLDGALMFLAAAAIVAVRRTREPVRAGE